MKKILWALLAMPLLWAAGCNTTNNDGEPEPMMDALTMYNQATNMNPLALDPFNVAYRLNILLNDAIENHGESQNNLDNVSATLQQSLFGRDTEITYSEGTYVIYYKGPKADKDFQRGGTLYIHTNGYPRLYTSGDTWDVSTDEPYMISLATGTGSSGSMDFSINLSPDPLNIEGEIDYPASYKIRTGDMIEWTIAAEHFNAWSQNEKGFPSDWTAEYQLSQAVFSLNPDDIAETTFNMSVSATNTKTMKLPQVSVETVYPIIYSAGCGYSTMVPGGKINISAVSGQGTTESCSVTFVEDPDNSCGIGAKLDYKGMTQTYY